MLQASESNWFKVWFDSKYYPILYRNRNNNEASAFLSALLRTIDLPVGSQVLDLACGRGRHSVWLSERGFDVLGVDLSNKSIEDAKKMENEDLHFAVRDMRDSHGSETFDAVFNLFTSFGYFDIKADNELVLSRVYQALKPGGYFILDYLNAHQVVTNLVHSEKKTVDDVVFSIERDTVDNQIVKTIEVEDGGEVSRYQERVTAFTEADFEQMFASTGFKVLAKYGDYKLNAYHRESSDRLIHVLQKPKA